MYYMYYSRLYAWSLLCVILFCSSVQGEKECLYNQNITLNQTTQFSVNSGETLQFYLNVTSLNPSSYYVITLQTAISNNISIYISLNDACPTNKYDFTFSSNGKLKAQFALSSKFSGITALNPGVPTNFYLTINPVTNYVPLTDQVSIGGLLQPYTLQFFYIDTQGRFDLNLISNNTTVYLRKDLPPTLSNYQMVDDNIGLNRNVSVQVCSSLLPYLNGRWYIALYSSTISYFTLTPYLIPGVLPALPSITSVTNGSILTSALLPGTTLYYSIQLAFHESSVLSITVTESIPTNTLTVFGSINQCPTASSNADLTAFNSGDGKYSIVAPISLTGMGIVAVKAGLLASNFAIEVNIVPNNISLLNDVPVTAGFRTGDILYFSYYLSLQQFTVTVTNISSGTLYLSNSNYSDVVDDSFRKFSISGTRNVTVNACDYGGDITGLWYFAIMNTGPKTYFQLRATSANYNLIPVIPGKNLTHTILPGTTDFYSLPSSEDQYMVTVRDLAVTNALVLSSNVQKCEQEEDATLPVITVNGIYSFFLSASYDYDIIVAVTSTASAPVNYSLVFVTQDPTMGVTLNENETYTGFIPPNSLTYFSYYVNKLSFNIQVDIENATVYFQKDTFPTLSQYVLSKTLNGSKNITISLCDYVDIKGYWYIGVYTIGDIQRFSIKALSNNYSDPVTFTGDATGMSQSITPASYQYYAIPVNDPGFIQLPHLVRISVNETYPNITDSILVLAKFNSCPTTTSANYGAQMSRGHSTLLVPMKNSGYLVVGVKSSMNTSYQISISIVPNNFSLNEGYLVNGVSLADLPLLFYLDSYSAFTLQLSAFQSYLYLRKDLPPTLDNYTAVDDNIYPTTREISLDQCSYPNLDLSGRWYLIVYRNASETTFSIKASFYQYNSSINVTTIEQNQALVNYIPENTLKYYLVDLQAEISELLLLQFESSSQLQITSKWNGCPSNTSLDYLFSPIPMVTNRYLYPVLQQGNYIMGIQSFDSSSTFNLTVATVANNVTLYPGDLYRGYLLPQTMMYFAVDSPLNGFYIQLSSTRTLVYLRREALPTNNNNDIADYNIMSTNRNITVDPCTGYQPQGKWYIGLYSPLKTNFTLQLFFNLERYGNVSTFNLNQTIQQTALINNTNLYSVAIGSYTNSLVHVTIDELNGENYLMGVVAKVNGCPSMFNWDYASFKFPNRPINLYYPTTQGNHIFNVLPLNNTIKYNLTTTIAVNNITLNSGIPISGGLRNNISMLFYLDVTKPYFQIRASTSLNTIIYLAKDHIPTASSYDFMSVNNVNYSREVLIDECSINIAVSGRWYISLYNSDRAVFFIQALNSTAQQCGNTNTTTTTTTGTTTSSSTGSSGCDNKEANECDDALTDCIDATSVTQKVLCACYHTYGECLLDSKCSSDERYKAFQLKCNSEGCAATQCNLDMVVSSSISLYNLTIWVVSVLIICVIYC